MQTYGFFNSAGGDRRYSADDWAAYFASFIGNGVFPNPSTGLQVVEDEGMRVAVLPGRAWINGYFLVYNTSQKFVLDNADGVLGRIDRVAVRWSLTDRTVTLIVKKGAFSVTPAPLVLERDGSTYELALADIHVAAGVTGITQADITDLRLDAGLCGIVHGTVDQVDTTTIFNQYLSWFQTFSANQEYDFVTWFDSVRDVLGDDAAGQLIIHLITLQVISIVNDNFRAFPYIISLEFPISLGGGLTN